MDRSRRLASLVAVALGAIALSGCAVKTVHSYVERGVDLNRYQRYSWGPEARTATGDPRLDNNEIFQQQVRAAVDKQLATKGFEKTTSGSPDLLVHYHASVEQRIDLRDKEPSTPCPECKPFIYDAGTLVVDLVDPDTSKVLWRGWSERNIDGAVDDQRWMKEEIDKTVARIFEDLPARMR
jgi:hypothetical protein